jgi:aerobic carbon-monoxide dehydrogenase medium subunit
VKPAAFSYHRARSLGELFALLATHGDAAKVIAGGQSLAPMLNMRLAHPAHLIDLNDLQELSFIREAGGAIAVGALARHEDVARSELMRTTCPLLAEAASTVGHYAIRSRGTLGGSLAHADPAAQLPLVAATLGAEIAIASPRGRRVVAAKDFFVSVMTTTLQADEIIVEAQFPKLGAREGSAFELFSRRRGDFAIVAVAATVALDGSGRATQVRLGVSGVNAVPTLLDETVRRFAGRRADAQWCRELAQDTRERIDPADDARMPAEFRRDLCAALTRRALEHSVARAQEK